MDNQNINPQKGGKPAVLLLYCTACTLLLIYLSLFTVFPVMELTGLAALGVFCACYGVLLKKGSFIMCLAAPGLSVAVSSFVTASQGGFNTASAVSFINIAFALALSAALNGCVVKKASGGAAFALLSAIGTAYISSLLLLVVYESYGSVSLDNIKLAINDAGAFIGSVFSAPPSLLPVEEGGVLAEEYAALAEDYKKTFAELGKTVELTFKLTVPSIIVTGGMLASAVIFILYKPFVRLAGMWEECFGDAQWKFNVSPASAMLFEVVFLVYIILSFFSDNAVLRVAFMNIMSVLTVPFSYLGLRHLAGIITDKLNSRVAAVAIVAASVICLMLLLGGSILSLAALIGASSVTKKMLDEKK